MASGDYPYPIPLHPACDSGLIAPPGLRGGDWAYGVTSCGFVVMAPWDATVYRSDPALRDAMDAHYRAEHPQEWKEIQISRAISAD